MPDLGELTRPDYEDEELLDTVGYLRSIRAEQEGDRDTIRFVLEIPYDAGTTFMEFRLLLDAAPTAAMAQLQLLLQAMRARGDRRNQAVYGYLENLVVHVHFNFADATHELGIAYLVGVVVHDGLDTIQDYFQRQTVTGWYTSEYPEPPIGNLYLASAFWGEIDRPAYLKDRLLDTVGYVMKVWVESENDRDAVRFELRIYWSSRVADERFLIPLDGSTTVALAQLQLLLDAQRSMWESLHRHNGTPLLVRVHFNFTDMWQRWGHVYWLQVVDGSPPETSVDQYFASRTPSRWFTDDFDA